MQLFETPPIDHLIEVHWDFKPRWTAYVVGAGECPHQHYDRDLAERCMGKMRRYLDHKARRADSGLITLEDGSQVVRVYREGPGRRPSRRPW